MILDGTDLYLFLAEKLQIDKVLKKVTLDICTHHKVQ
jgi:hypothetical protein